MGGWELASIVVHVWPGILGCIFNVSTHLVCVCTKKLLWKRLVCASFFSVTKMCFTFQPGIFKAKGTKKFDLDQDNLVN